MPSFRVFDSSTSTIIASIAIWRGGWSAPRIMPSAIATSSDAPARISRFAGALSRTSTTCAPASSRHSISPRVPSKRAPMVSASSCGGRNLGRT